MCFPNVFLYLNYKRNKIIFKVFEVIRHRVRLRNVAETESNKSVLSAGAFECPHWSLVGVIGIISFVNQKSNTFLTVRIKSNFYISNTSGLIYCSIPEYESPLIKGMIKFDYK